MVAVTLFHRQGYFSQHLDAHGRQTEAPVHWAVDDSLTPLVSQVPRPGDWPPGIDPRLALSGAEMVLGLGGVHM